MKQPVLAELGIFAAELHYKALPEEVRQRAGWVLADTLAAMVAGAAEPEVIRLANAMPSVGSANLLGLGRKTLEDYAALLNGTAGTVLEMDEGNRFARGHPAIHVIPAALAVVQSDPSVPQEERGARFMAAMVAGYEVAARMGAASVLRGAMHPHGTWGTLGAAAAAARVLGFSSSEMAESINLASAMTIATSKQTMFEGGLVRNVYAGLSNRQGILAVRLCQAGFNGEINGPASLFGKIVSETFDTAAVLRDLGGYWQILQNYFKLHSCCRYNHGALDAIDLLQKKGELPHPNEIASIEVQTYHLAAELLDPAPVNTLAAKFSLPFAVATRLVHGNSALTSFTWEAVQNPAARALAARVRVMENPEMSRRLPLERPARVTILTHHGDRYSAEVGANRGDDALPYTAEELSHKFVSLVSRVWPVSHAQALLAATLRLAEYAEGFDHWSSLLDFPTSLDTHYGTV